MQNKEEKFKQIVNENSERMHRICRYYNSNPEDLEDMYQEILINIWKSLESFRGDSAPSTWVYRVAVNTALTYTGKAYREMKLNVDTDKVDFNNLVDDNELADKIEKEKQYDQLQIELNQLSVIDKTLISLSLEQLSTREISDIIGISESNVKVKLHRIKSRLRTKLNGGNHENNK